MRPTNPKRSAPSPVPTFTADDLLGALAATLTKPQTGDGLTSDELAEKMQLSRARVREALRAAHKAGRLVPTPVYRLSIDGKMRPTTLYRLTGA